MFHKHVAQMAISTLKTSICVYLQVLHNGRESNKLQYDIDNGGLKLYIIPQLAPIIYL